MKCSCYCEETECHYDHFLNRSIERKIGRCNGTKERDVCSCCGDESKCDFYPEKREKAAKVDPMDFCGVLCDFAEDIINRQKAEIERLEKENKNLLSKLCKKVRTESKVVEKLIKAEAIKEFAERLCEEVDRMLNENWLFEAQAISSLYSIKNFIEKIKKEMVGDE